MRRSRVGSAALAACMLLSAACGGSGEANDTAGETASSAKLAGGAKPAPKAEAADDGLGKLKCPAKANKSLAGPDIIGVKLGMARDEALNVVRCHTKDAHIEFEDRWFDPRTLNSYQLKLEKQAFTAQSGETSACSYRTFEDMQRCGMGNRVWDHVSESIKVAAPGVPGNETVVGVWRMQSFKEGETPAVETVIAALTEKYGPFQRKTIDKVNNNLWSDRIELAWASDLDGNPLSEANPSFNQCAFNVRGRSVEGQTWRDGCGMSIGVTLLSPRTNPDVVGELHVGMMHQSNLYAYGEALQMQLEEIEQKRRREELENAKSSDVKL